MLVYTQGCDRDSFGITPDMGVKHGVIQPLPIKVLDLNDVGVGLCLVGRYFGVLSL